MTDQKIHEEEFVRYFINPDKKERYLSMLKTKFGRKKLLHRLDHITAHELDLRYVQRISVEAHTVSSLHDLLTSKGAPDICSCLSVNPSLDGLRVPLSDALSSTVGMSIGTIISCLSGRLGYFEGEDKGAWFLCEKLPR